MNVIVNYLHALNRIFSYTLLQLHDRILWSLGEQDYRAFVSNEYNSVVGVRV